MILIACESAEQSQSHKQHGDVDGDLRRAQLEMEVALALALACNRNVNILMMELNEHRVDFHSVDPLKYVSLL